PVFGDIDGEMVAGKIHEHMVDRLRKELPPHVREHLILVSRNPPHKALVGIVVYSDKILVSADCFQKPMVPYPVREPGRKLAKRISRLKPYIIFCNADWQARVKWLHGNIG